MRTCGQAHRRLAGILMASAAVLLLCVSTCAAGAAAASHPPLPATAGGVNTKWPGEPGVFADPPPMFRGSVDDTSCNVEEVERANTQQVCTWKPVYMSLLSMSHTHVLAQLSVRACCLCHPAQVTHSSVPITFKSTSLYLIASMHPSCACMGSRALVSHVKQVMQTAFVHFDVLVTVVLINRVLAYGAPYMCVCVFSQCLVHNFTDTKSHTI